VAGEAASLVTTFGAGGEKGVVGRGGGEQMYLKLSSCQDVSAFHHLATRPV